MTDAILIVYIALLLIIAGLLLMGISLMVEERLRVRAARLEWVQWLRTGDIYEPEI